MDLWESFRVELTICVQIHLIFLSNTKHTRQRLLVYLSSNDSEAFSEKISLQ